MFARVNTFRGPVEGMDASLEDARAQALPALDAVDGYAGIVVLLERATGRSIAITFWESEEAMRASEAAATEIRSSSTRRNDEQIVSVERFEVGLVTLGTAVGTR